MAIEPIIPVQRKRLKIPLITSIYIPRDIFGVL